jgi:hypothetical protein
MEEEKLLPWIRMKHGQYINTVHQYSQIKIWYMQSSQQMEDHSSDLIMWK